MHIVITRPKEDSLYLIENLIKLGHVVNDLPVIKIEKLETKKINLQNYQSVIFTSSNAIRFMNIDDSIKLERMAILFEFRTKNYGISAISQLIEYYVTKGYNKMILDSIYSVRNFYKKCGFVEEGEIFQRVGIDHIRMSLTL